MTKILYFALKIKGGGRRVAHAKSSDPATPSKFGTCTCMQSYLFLSLLVLFFRSAISYWLFFDKFFHGIKFIVILIFLLFWPTF